MKSRVVYSTDKGRHCPDCQQPTTGCKCKQINNAIISNPAGVVKLHKETKGRKGKGVTLISGLPLAPLELQILAKELKQFCSSGGSVKNAVIEIQGDQRTILLPVLQAKGYTVKLSGG